MPRRNYAVANAFPTRVDHWASNVRTICKMKTNSPHRAETAVIGSADTDVIEAAYALAKVHTEQAAKDVLYDIPAATYPALIKHMRARPRLFLPAVFDVVVRAIDGRKLSDAELLFV